MRQFMVNPAATLIGESTLSLSALTIYQKLDWCYTCCEHECKIHRINKNREPYFVNLFPIHLYFVHKLLWNPELSHLFQILHPT